MRIKGNEDFKTDFDKDVWQGDAYKEKERAYEHFSKDFNRGKC